MNEARIAQIILAERKRALKLAFDPESIFDPNFPQQKAFCQDPAKLKVLFCTRRAAKSFTLGLYLIHEALTNPKCNVLFVGLTRASAKAIVWKDILHVINDKFNLGAEFNKADLTMTFPNGSLLAITGADADENEMKKLLGRKYRVVGIDEASMYTINMKNLVYGVLKPAMTDPNLGGERGTIALSGTSSDFPSGLFYNITTGAEPGWSVHTWTAHDNPYVAKQWQEELDEIAAQRPLYMETPQYRQWYKNEWVIDEEKLVYKFSVPKNLAPALPTLSPAGWVYMLGVDLGWEDDNGFVHMGYHENDPHLYIISAWKKAKMTFDQVALAVEAYRTPMALDLFLAWCKSETANSRMDLLTYQQIIKAYQAVDGLYPCKTVIDGANKQGVESMRSRTSIPFEYADKQDKATFIELCNGDLIQGKIKFLPAAQPLPAEMMALVWKTEGGKIILPKKEHPNLPNHLCDGFLYGWKMGYHFHGVQAKPTITVGSRQWYEQQSQEIWEREKEQFTRQESDWPTAEGWNSL